MCAGSPAPVYSWITEKSFRSPESSMTEPIRHSLNITGVIPFDMVDHCRGHSGSIGYFMYIIHDPHSKASGPEDSVLSKRAYSKAY